MSGKIHIERRIGQEKDVEVEITALHKDSLILDSTRVCSIRRQTQNGHWRSDLMLAVRSTPFLD